jgi:hypothetical protein
MNEIDRLAKLAASAEHSASTQIPDLADRVLADIRRGGRATGNRVWPATAAATFALAIIAAVSAAQAWSSLGNPLSDLSDAPTHTVEMR